MARTLHAASKAANISKSLNSFVDDALRVNDGYDLDWGQPNFKEDGLLQWIQFRAVSSSSDFQRQVDSTRLGDIRSLFLNFNIFVRWPHPSNIYDHEGIKNAIFQRMFLADIPIKDYDTAGSPQEGLIQVTEQVNDAEIDSGRESGLYQWNMNFVGKMVFKHS